MSGTGYNVGEHLAWKRRSIDQRTASGLVLVPGRNSARSARAGGQEGGQALSMLYIRGMEVRRKRPRGFK
jgi:hypothetical protein